VLTQCACPAPHCRVLGRLRRLHLLELQGATNPDHGAAVFNSSASKYRPSLPSLTSLHIGACAGDLGTIFHTLARWTDIPSSCTLVLPGVMGNGLVAVWGWVPGWLRALLAAPEAGSGMHILLACDDDVHAYVSALTDLHPLPPGMKHAVCLNHGVGTAAFRCLLGCTAFPAGELQLLRGATRMGDGTQLPSYVLEWDRRSRFQLRPRYFAALVGGACPGLISLTLDDCELVTSREVAVLVSVAPGLQELRLLDASLKLSDKGMYALVGCRQLAAVHITNAGRVTPAGVALLLTLVPGLRVVTLGGLGASRMEALAGEYSAMHGDLKGLWAMEKNVSAGLMSWVRRAA
jgi:hypothetical protein